MAISAIVTILASCIATLMNPVAQGFSHQFRKKTRIKMISIRSSSRIIKQPSRKIQPTGSRSSKTIKLGQTGSLEKLPLSNLRRV